MYFRVFVRRLMEAPTSTEFLDTAQQTTLGAALKLLFNKTDNCYDIDRVCNDVCIKANEMGNLDLKDVMKALIITKNDMTRQHIMQVSYKALVFDKWRTLVLETTLQHRTL